MESQIVLWSRSGTVAGSGGVIERLLVTWLLSKCQAMKSLGPRISG